MNRVKAKRKASGKSLTSRTLDALRKDGWNPWIVEVFNHWSGTRLDLWNFGDVLAMKVGEPHLIIQTTSYSNVSARVKKILAEPRAFEWLSTGGRIVVHGWHKVGHWWKCREVWITTEMFDASVRQEA